MLKLLGSIVVTIAGGLTGMVIARSYSLRPMELRYLQSALQMLETEITYTATPLAEALGLVAARADNRVAPLFEQTRAELLSMSGCTAGEAWENALRKFYPQSALLTCDFSILRSLGSALGISDSRDQSKHLRLAMEQIGMEINRAESNALRHVKLWNYLGFLGGLVIVLLFY
jgi:stage III sporulation protein AB